MAVTETAGVGLGVAEELPRQRSHRPAYRRHLYANDLNGAMAARKGIHPSHDKPCPENVGVSRVPARQGFPPLVG